MRLRYVPDDCMVQPFYAHCVDGPSVNDTSAGDVVLPLARLLNKSSPREKWLLSGARVHIPISASSLIGNTLQR